ncbi:MAG TPA: MarR family transcriptional regulator [Methylophaga sp.]|nr:MarR family transcriptional regulator [Methylophaga sp.]
MGPILDDQVCYALYTTSGLVTQAYADLLKPHGLTYPQFVVLMALWESDGKSMTQLAKRINLSKATVSPILKKMEQSGWISRASVPGNDRLKSVLLTEQGKGLAEEGKQITQAALCSTGLSQSEANDLLSLCSKIRNKLNTKNHDSINDA